MTGTNNYSNMKLMHTSTTSLSTREFNKLSEKIIDSLYDLNSDIRDIYDIHINYIDDGWRIDFIPINAKFPVVKVDTYTEYNDDNDEILKITPKSLTELPEQLKLKDGDKSYDMCMNYVNIFEFILALYDFEYEL